MMKKIILLILVILLMSTVQVMADEGVNVVVKKTAPAEVIKGDILPVTIHVTNNLPEAITVTIKECFGGANAVDMGGLKRNTQKITSAPPYYEGSITIDASSKGSITYKIRPLYFGRLIIPATRVYTPMGEIQSNTLTVMVECNRNNICEVDEDENSVTCPKDCSPGGRDRLCSPLSDGICDPDCKEGRDPDCKVTTETSTSTVTTPTMPVNKCGDNICSGEDYGSCPRDCPSGGMDGFCDGLGDGVCDPDCLPEEDPDCSKPTPVYLMLIMAAVVIVVIAVAYKRWLNTGD